MIMIKKFSKPGCMPCKALAHYLRQIDLNEVDAVLENIDITEHPEVIDQYNLSSVPVLVLERNGIEVTRLIGLRPPEEIEDAIQYAKEVR
jgi:thioredoxin 1